ncbi:MAG: hypothetical protein K8I27_08560 [Planctomycetes bacterium]|nr:hypothetical protein [Planctomycetota bacterium]
MRQANWHEEGGNAKALKGTEEDALVAHQAPQYAPTHAGRGAQADGQPDHKAALYPKFPPRRRA